MCEDGIGAKFHIAFDDYFFRDLVLAQWIPLKCHGRPLRRNSTMLLPSGYLILMRSNNWLSQVCVTWTGDAGKERSMLVCVAQAPAGKIDWSYPMQKSVS